MTPPAKVIIPWRPEPSREAGFEWLVRYYSHRFGADSVHVETDDTDGPLNKSRLINRAVSQRKICCFGSFTPFSCG